VATGFSWFTFGFSMILGILFIVLALWLIAKRQEKFSAPILGLCTLAAAILIFGAVQPDEFKIAGFEGIRSRLRQIEKNLRPYAIIDPHKKAPINQTFPDGIFEYRGFYKAQSEDGQNSIRFWLKEKPAYLEVRSNGGKKFKIIPTTAGASGVEYTAELDGFSYEQQDKDPYQLIIEAFFE